MRILRSIRESVLVWIVAIVVVAAVMYFHAKE